MTPLKQALLISLMLMIFATENSIAQTNLSGLKFERFSIDYGLSQGSVRVLFQDSRDFIWIGTEDGLNRFDGYSFVVYAPGKGPFDLVDRTINAITEDNKGTLWVGTNRGISRLASDTEFFVQFSAADFNNDQVNALLPANDGGMWIAANSGLYYVDRQDRVKPLSSELASLIYVIDLLKINDHILWLATLQGMVEVNIDSGTIKRLSLHPIESKNSDLKIQTLFRDSKGRVWIGTAGNGLFVYNPQNQQFEQYTTTTALALAENNVYSITEDHKGRIWLGGDNRGATMFIDNNHLVQLSHDPLRPMSLSSNSIAAMLSDRFNNMWVGTLRSGLNLHRAVLENFQHLKQLPGDNQLVGNDVRALTVDSKQRLWAGFYGTGVTVFKRVDRSFKAIAKVKRLRGVQPYAIKQDDAGDIWISTEAAVNRVNPNTFAVEQHFNTTNSALEHLYVTSIADDHQGSLWFAHWYQGLSRYHKQTGQFSFYSTQNSNLASSAVSTLWVDEQNTLWITGNAGLSSYINHLNRFENYPLDGAGTSQSRQGYHFNNLFGDNQNRLWLTERNGVYLFDREKRSLIKPSLPEFFRFDTIYDVQQANDGTFWLTGNKGLLSFQMNDQRYRRYINADGIQSNEFNAGSSARFNDGSLAFGGVNGISYFNPQTLPPRLADLTIAGMEIHKPLSAPVIKHRIHNQTLIQLQHDYAWLSLSLANLAFEDNKKNQFAYRVLGLSDKWVDINHSNRIILPRIAPGNYQIEFINKSSDGLAVLAKTQLQLVIDPPWYQTSLALFSYVLLMITAIYVWQRYKLQRLKRHAQQLKQEVALRTQTIVSKNEEINRHAEALVNAAQEKTTLMENLSHELRTPITLILGPVKQLRNALNTAVFEQTVALIERNALQLNRLVNQLLDLSHSHANNNADESCCNLSQTAEEMVQSFDHYAHHGGLTLSAEIPPQIYLPYRKEEVEKVLSNLLSNAIKYNKNQGQIQLRIQQRLHQAVMTVSDSGIGIAPEHLDKIFNRFFRVDPEHNASAESSGIGLNIVKNIISAHHDSITIDSELGKGTVFTVTFDIVQSPEEKQPSQNNMLESTLGEGDNSRQTLLIIDDNKDMLSYLSSLLTEQYNVQTESNSLTALEIARNTIPDLIISDVMMPNLSGMELLESIKQDELTNHIPVILLTAKGSEKSRLQGLALRADAYLAKPFNQQEVLLCIRNLLDSRDLLKKKVAAQLLQPTAFKPVNQPDEFIVKLDGIIEKHYSDPQFTVAILSKEMALGERQLLRKLRAIADTSVAEYIRVYRLKKAAELLQQGITPSNVALDVGFSSLAYFSNCFKAYHGKAPSQF